MTYRLASALSPQKFCLSSVLSQLLYVKFTQLPHSVVTGVRNACFDMVSRQKNISVIFFDLDNTLIPTRKADKIACNKLSEILWEKYAIPLEYSKQICTNYLRAFRKCPDNPTMSLDNWRCLLWTQALGDQYSHMAGDIYLKWLHLRYHYLALTPEIQSLLNKLHNNYLLALITNGPSRAQWEKINKLNLKNFFDLILVSGDLPWEKPQHEIFDEACMFLGVSPQQCLMVGDKLETDILGGLNAKLGGTVWVPLGTGADDNCNDYIPDYIVEKVTDLPTILPKNCKVLQRHNRFNKLRRNMPDLEDCNSNSSDGS